MTVLAWTPPTVGFADVTQMRTWLADLDAKMQAIGLVKTADTGQLDVSTVELPGGTGNTTITNVGYFIYRFNDALQAACPIFIRVVISSRGMATPRKYPFSYITVGTGTDGAGNLTGIVSSTFANTAGYAQTSDNFPGSQAISRIVYNEARGFFGIVHCPGLWNTTLNVTFSPVCFFISRTQNADGTPNNKGFSICGRQDTYAGAQAYNTAASPFTNTQTLSYQTITPGGAYPSAYSVYGFPYFPVQDVIGVDPQLQRAYNLVPGVEPNYNLLSVPTSAYTDGVEFTAVNGGSTAKNFITVPLAAGARSTPVGVGSTLAMLWE